MANNEVLIVDYGMGNLWSVASAIKFLGKTPVVTSDLSVISTSETLILPGVGSFRRAMDTIRKQSIDKAIFDSLENPNTKLLGICLGMQLLGASSTEDGPTAGLGLVQNEVVRLSKSETSPIKIPHVGFNKVQMPNDSKLFEQIPIDASFYFVHSYAMQILNDISIYTTTTYGHQFVAAIESGQVFGTQFHPEKSQKNGLKVLENFLR
ncbi:MAG: imidazole glycerol phosphate synthase subunit HisH [Acidimicrobiia bacterium]|nr:imidazole glycerol phosphate synthase subunit HisH [Acidimicrobiia bacterium]